MPNRTFPMLGRMRALLAGFLVGLAGPVVPAAVGFGTVVIDPGHGGHDRGGIPGQRVSEKEMTLDVARRLETVLRDAGLRTVMTRRTDRFVPLSERVAAANRHRDAIFVSVHFNSASREGACGAETYYYRPSGRSLAAAIQERLVRFTAMQDRGLKQRGFYVLRHSRNPAVLVECGFLTNRAEARRILQVRHRDRLAREIAEALLEARGATRFRSGTLQASR